MRCLSAPAALGKEKDEYRTEWDFKIPVEVDIFADLNYTTCGHIVLGTPEMENEYGWKHLDKDSQLASLKPNGPTCTGCGVRVRLEGCVPNRVRKLATSTYA
jgi:hypothetical protein